MRQLLREPLLHFLILGGVLFAWYGAISRDRAPTPSSHEIELTLDDLRQLDLQFESKWRRPPTPDEFARLVEQRVQEEVLYREALALGLDQDDTIIRRRLAQKMQFLSEDVAASHEPTDAELRAWYVDHSEMFALPGRVSFRQIYFSPDARGEDTLGDASLALASLSSEPIDSEHVAALGDPIMLQDYYGDRSSVQLATDFGPAFAVDVFEIEPGSWQGPIESGYGWHLIFVESSIPGRSPDFAEVARDVKVAWLADQKARAWREAYDAMRETYTVLIPAPPDTGSDAPPEPAPTAVAP